MLLVAISATIVAAHTLRDSLSSRFGWMMVNLALLFGWCAAAYRSTGDARIRASKLRIVCVLTRLGELDKLLALEALILRHRGQKVCTTEPAISVVFCSRAAR